MPFFPDKDFLHKLNENTNEPDTSFPLVKFCFLLVLFPFVTMGLSRWMKKQTTPVPAPQETSSEAQNCQQLTAPNMPIGTY
jgi:hypothetical protein